MLNGLRTLMFFSKSLRRIADALDEQNRLTRIHMETNGITIPDPKRKFSKEEREVEVTYETIQEEEWK